MIDRFNNVFVRQYDDNDGSDGSSDGLPLRSLYSGDISSTIQQRFAVWLKANGYISPLNSNSSYYCVRNQERVYTCFYGDIEQNGSINDAVRLTYTAVSSGGYATAYTWSVAHVQSGSVDLDGYSGYIYSSYSEYQPNQYIEEYKTDAVISFSVVALLAFVCICSLGRLIKGWFINGK